MPRSPSRVRDGANCPFIKALGDGLYHPLDRVDVSLTPGEPAKILRVESTSRDDCGWRMESFCPASGLIAAVVTESRKLRAGFAPSFPDLA